MSPPDPPDTHPQSSRPADPGQLDGVDTRNGLPEGGGAGVDSREDGPKPIGALDAVTSGGVLDAQSVEKGREDTELTGSVLSSLRPLRDFEEFYRSEYRSVVGLVYALCGVLHVAQDLAHDAFAEAYERWDRIGRYGGSTPPSVGSGLAVLRCGESAM
jgi:hypothetical protein